MNAKLHSFGAYQKARELFDLTVADVTALRSEPRLWRLVGQHLAAVDSIAANIEEGFGRGSPRDYAHFLAIARGSAQETAGRVERLGHWLPAEVVARRTALLGEIIGILSRSIRTLREKR